MSITFGENGARKVKTRAEIGEERRERMRLRLIAAGARVLAKNQETRATIDDFIEEAKVARGTFYNHFPTRGDLFDALWQTIGRDPFFQIQRTYAPVGNPVLRFALFTRHILHLARLDPTWGWLILALSVDRTTMNPQLRSYPLPYLKAGKEAGFFHFDDLACAGDLVVGAVRSGMRMMLEEPRGNQYPEMLSKMILMALGMSGETAEQFGHAPLIDLAA